MPRHPYRFVHAVPPSAIGRRISILAIALAACGCGAGSSTSDAPMAAPPPPSLPASTTAHPTTSVVEVQDAPTDPASETVESADPLPEHGEETTTATDDGAVQSEPVTEPSTTSSTTEAPSPTTSEPPPATTSTTEAERSRGRTTPTRPTTAGRSTSTTKSTRTETRVIVVYSASPSRFGGANPFVTSAEEASFFDCVIYRESRGNPGAVNGSSGAAGLYQFLPSTWNSTARAAGRPDLVGLNPATVDVNNQHYLAHFLYLWQGKSPWSPSDGCR